MAPPASANTVLLQALCQKHLPTAQGAAPASIGGQLRGACSLRNWLRLTEGALHCLTLQPSLLVLLQSYALLCITCALPCYPLQGLDTLRQ